MKFNKFIFILLFIFIFSLNINGLNAWSESFEATDGTTWTEDYYEIESYGISNQTDVPCIKNNECILVCVHRSYTVYAGQDTTSHYVYTYYNLKDKRMQVAYTYPAFDLAGTSYIGIINSSKTDLYHMIPAYYTDNPDYYRDSSHGPAKRILDKLNEDWDCPNYGFATASDFIGEYQYRGIPRVCYSNDESSHYCTFSDSLFGSAGAFGKNYFYGESHLDYNIMYQANDNNTIQEEDVKNYFDKNHVKYFADWTCSNWYSTLPTLVQNSSSGNYAINSGTFLAIADLRSKMKLPADYSKFFEYTPYPFEIIQAPYEVPLPIEDYAEDKIRDYLMYNEGEKAACTDETAITTYGDQYYTKNGRQYIIPFYGVDTDKCTNYLLQQMLYKCMIPLYEQNAELLYDEQIDQEEYDALQAQIQAETEAAASYISDALKFDEDDIIFVPKKCSEIVGDNFIKFINLIYLLVFKISTPILFLVLSMIDFMKSTAIGEEALKKASSKLITRAIIIAVIFLLPYLIRLIGIITGLDTSCIQM